MRLEEEQELPIVYWTLNISISQRVEELVISSVRGQPLLTYIVINNLKMSVLIKGSIHKVNIYKILQLQDLHRGHKLYQMLDIIEMNKTIERRQILDRLMIEIIISIWMMDKILYEIVDRVKEWEEWCITYMTKGEVSIYSKTRKTMRSKKSWTHKIKNQITQHLNIPYKGKVVV